MVAVIKLWFGIVMVGIEPALVRKIMGTYAWVPKL